MKIRETNQVIIASIKLQNIILYHNGKSEKVYQMSSSKNPPSCVDGSLGTPWGLHEICEKIGEDQPMGMVFEGRKPIGLKFWECSQEKNKRNLITSRILRLMGLEEGVNKGGKVDSFDRYIYLHGTNHESRLGSPSSSGCLQLSNKEILELFEKISLKSHLLILRDS